jgi:hypothetical protein
MTIDVEWVNERPGLWTLVGVVSRREIASVMTCTDNPKPCRNFVWWVSPKLNGVRSRRAYAIREAERAAGVRP